jgi:hypothetical protein
VKRQLFITLAFLAACGKEDPDHQEPSLEEELCEHLQDGPPKAITATPTATGAPDGTADHTRIDVTLVALTAMNGGTVTYAASAAGDYAIALSKNVPLVIKKASDGSAVAFEESSGQSTSCPELAAMHRFELAIGTYTLELGPTAETSVSFVVEEAEHEDAHE